MVALTRVIVLGGTGMLGAAVARVLHAQTGVEVVTTFRSLGINITSQVAGGVALDVDLCTDDTLAALLSHVQPDIVINCIGVINRYCRDDDAGGVRRAIRVNAAFPHQLAAVVSRLGAPVRVISIATDCVFSGRVGRYDELSVHDPTDFYGKSKSLGEVQAECWLNVRCSIIGPEPIRRTSLMEWFRSHPPGARVLGYTNHRWNGVTTLQFARFCIDVIVGARFDALRRFGHTIHYVPNQSVSKYELLCLINEALRTNYTVEPAEAPGGTIDRTLTSVHLHLPVMPMQDAVTELANEMSSGALAW